MRGTRPTCPRCGEAHYRHDCPIVKAVRSCVNCCFMLRQDEGYSNYTVTDTHCSCLVEAHPQKEAIDFPYGADDEPEKFEWGKAALNCEWFTQGEGPEIDVEHENKHDVKQARRITLAAKDGKAAAIAAYLGLYEPSEETDV